MTRLVFNEVPLEITADSKGYTAVLDGRTIHAELAEADEGRLDLQLDGGRLAAYVSSDGQSRWVTVHGRTFLLARSSTVSASGSAHGASSELSAPMPGQVRAVNVNAGDSVTKGQVLIVLEAMKMEIRLHAPFEGTVSSVDAQLGQTVEREQVLVRLQPPTTHS